MNDAARSRTPALFLDRDGVINIDSGYIHRIDQFEFLPGIFELARLAVRQLCWPIVIVTNQSGIGRGLFDENEYQVLTQWMCNRFRNENAPVAKVYHCPFHPVFGIGRYRVDHEWRKPKPGMILQAAADLNLDLATSVLVGDRLSDVEAAAAAGIALRIRLDPMAQPPDSTAPSHLVARDLPEVASVLQAAL